MSLYPPSEIGKAISKYQKKRIQIIEWRAEALLLARNKYHRLTHKIRTEAVTELQNAYAKYEKETANIQ